jgi:type II secretory pathway pseudopilin PulG
MLWLSVLACWLGLTFTSVFAVIISLAHVLSGYSLIVILPFLAAVASIGALAVELRVIGAHRKLGAYLISFSSMLLLSIPACWTGQVFAFIVAILLAHVLPGYLASVVLVVVAAAVSVSGFAIGLHIISLRRSLNTYSPPVPASGSSVPVSPEGERHLRVLSAAALRHAATHKKAEVKDIFDTIKGTEDQYSRAGLEEVNDRLHRLYAELGPPANEES